MRGRPWGSNDRTRGPLDRLFDDLRGRLDGLIVERLEVKHPADDDNVFYLRDARGIDEVQIDTHPHGQTPFYLESDAHPMIETADVAEAVAIVQSWLQGEPTPM
jgi:hypothetical protein